MRLHRTNGQADWADIAPLERNDWQRLAAATRGWITPGNLITALGFAVVLYGLFAIGQQRYWLGLSSLALGRLCDLLDGLAADRTHTKSPLGEFLDVTVDKLTVLGIVVVFFASHLIPVWLLIALVVPHLLISVLTIVAYLRHRPLHPSKYGKYNMAAVWGVMGGFVLAYALHMSASWLMTLLECAAVLTVVSGLMVAFSYAKSRD